MNRLLDLLLRLLKWPTALGALLLLPGAVIAFKQLVEMVYRSPESAEPFLLGLAAYGVLWVVFLRRRSMIEGSFWSTLEHEFTHILFTLLTFGRVRGLVATHRSGGRMEFEGYGNWLVAGVRGVPLSPDACGRSLWTRTFVIGGALGPLAPTEDQFGGGPPHVGSSLEWSLLTSLESGALGTARVEPPNAGMSYLHVFIDRWGRWQEVAVEDKSRLMPWRLLRPEGAAVLYSGSMTSNSGGCWSSAMPVTEWLYKSCSVAGVCSAAATSDCADGDACTADSCSPKNGCYSVAWTAGTPCPWSSCPAPTCPGQ